MRACRPEFVVFLIALAGTAALAEGYSSRQDSYPSRNVTFVVPYQAGGATDLMARLVGQRLEQRLGRPLVVENRPGAGTALAAPHVARQPADRYTNFLGTRPNPAVQHT